jgi:hypothetical protein
MATRPGITINKQNGGLGRRSNSDTDAVFGLVLSAPSINGGMQNGVVYPLASVKDAVAIGITAAYDSTNHVLVYHHIYRFFARNPNAFLYLLTAPQTASLADMCDVDQSYAKYLLRSQNGNIKYIGIARNPATGYTPTLQGGFDEDVLNAVPKAQAIYNSEALEFRYADFLIEGRSFNGTAASMTDLATLNSPQVSITAVADLAISNANAAYAGYAAVGDVLGLISLAAVSQNAGENTDAFNLLNAGLGFFVKAGLSSGLDIHSYTSADLDTLNTKRLIVPDITPGVTGYHLNDTHTCDAVDNNDFAYIEDNRTIEKAMTLIRVALLPKVKSRLLVDTGTGQLLSHEAKDIETLGKKSLLPMQTAGDISGGIDVYVDPNQDVLATSLLNVEATFTPVAIGRQITINIGFSNPSNA